MKELHEYDTEELEKELERRRKQQVTPPAMLFNPDIEDLEETMIDYTDYLVSEDYHPDNDWKQRIYEAAIKAFFGEQFWDWYHINFQEYLYGRE